MQAQELNTTSGNAFEREVQHRIDETEGAFALFIVELGNVGKLLARVGQAAATRFLNSSASSLRKVCRDGDRLLRIGDHTFGILINGLTSDVHLQLAAQKIVRLYEQTVRDADVPLQTDIHMGASKYPDHSANAPDLIQNARVAVEAARRRGVSFLVYAPESVATMSMKWNLSEELSLAIETNALELHYQPKLSAKTGQVIGAEALLRWTNDKLGQVPPEVFLPAASEIGMMNDLTRFILTTALQQASQWPRLTRPYNVSINLEADSMKNPEIVDIVSSSLSIFGSEQCNLTLEITETALVEDSGSNFKCLKRLKDLGVGVSIDDFGTGYSSLSYFKNIPATELKIDRSFVANMFESDEEKNLVEAIIWLAHRFGLSVVAEGVETAEQQALLTKMNCDVLQGYLFSKPRSSDEFARWVSLQNKSPRS